MSTLVVVLLCLAAAVATAQSRTNQLPGVLTHDEVYLDGLKAYTDKRWGEAITYFGKALSDYQKVEEARLKCFAKCKSTRGKISSGLYFSSDEDLQFFTGVLQRGACIERCKKGYVGARPQSAIPNYIGEQLKNKEGYHYLQMALYQDRQLKQAAQASATYAYHNPKDINAKVNMNYYRGKPTVTPEDLTPLHSQPYRNLYVEGQEHYRHEEWSEMVEKFEHSLKVFPSALDQCKTLCEGPMRYDGSLDFAQAITWQYISLMECRVHCMEKLGDFRDNQEEELLGSYFHYLQYGYYMLNRSLDAIQASATQVRVEPHSEVAKRNGVFYRQQPGVTRKDFIPREDVLPLIQQLEEEHAFLHILDELSGHMEQEHVKGEGGDDSEMMLDQDFLNFPIGSHQPKPESTPVIVETAEDHDGVERLVVDQMISENQCRLLMNLASQHAKEGDGYGRKTPHTYYEKFEGLNILDAAKVAASGMVNQTLSQLYMDASRMVRDTLAQQFHLQTPLYFSYTHLVCRTAKEGIQDSRSDLSHPVHSDNCVLDEALGECFKVSPAYTWRDYSAILYLNEDFDGGKFFFAHSPKDRTPAVFVEPKCGRMVGFSAGKENMHGVTAVTRGRRCAVALWFTLDSTHREASFDTAENILRGLGS